MNIVPKIPVDNATTTENVTKNVKREFAFFCCFSPSALPTSALDR